MRYFFILGTNAVLSTAEISALLDSATFTVSEISRHALVVDAAPGTAFDAAALMHRLGGTIKIGEITADAMPIDAELLAEHMLERLANRKNVTFGLSVYSLEAESPENKAGVLAARFKDVGMQVKRRLKEAHCSARWVKAQMGTALTSVVVGKNNMLDEGGEFVVLGKKGEMLVGKTLAIQPFEEFSLVDYGRPERDTIQGMLPPKLARIMINISGAKNGALLDPFCGSGTILTEAMQIGFAELYGSDKNPKAVESTQKNIEWLKGKNLVPATTNATVFTSDARNIGQQIKDHAIDAIVSEPFLGPPRSGQEKRGEIQKILHELSKLYYESLSSWKRILKPGAPVVLALPVYILGGEKHGMSTKEFEKLGFKTEQLVPTSVASRLGTSETKNHGLLYGRKDQLVWREIVRLRLAK